MEIRLKINIVNRLGEPFMGPGSLRLLEKVAEHGSINRAAKEMSLSYVKALKMLNRLEKSLGQKLLIRSRGGSKRGGTELTPFGQSYIEEYDRLQTRLGCQADREFDSFMKRVERKRQNAYS